MRNKLLRRSLCFLLPICLLLPVFSAFAQEPSEPASGFRDVPDNAWYRDAVVYTVEKGYFSGVGGGRFSPSGTMTRAMMATVLWRIAGSPEPAVAPPFRDVKRGKYYYKAAAWAYESCIITGTTPETFSPKAEITRQQMALMLYRFALSQGGDAEEGDQGLRSFPDRDKVSGYARQAVSWAVKHWLLRGRARDGISWLQPKAKLTRAEAAVMIRRFDEQILGGLPLTVAAPEEAPEPEESLRVWIEGTAAEACPVWEEACVPVGALAEALGGTADTEENICLEFDGHIAFLSKKNGALLFDDEAAQLSSPCKFYAGEWYVPASFLTAFCGMDFLADEEQSQVFYTRIVRAEDVPEGKRVVILRYHCVTDDVWGTDEEAFISPNVLEEQIVKMKELGCSFLTFEDLDRVDEYEYPVLLTFDDGYRDNYTELYPILQRQNVRATVFMITKYVGSKRSLTAEQLRELSASGLVSIQSHTRNHKDLTTFTEDQLRADFETSRLDLARITGKIPFVLCYPKGKRNELTEAVAAEYYRFGILANTDAWITGTDPFAVSRFGIHRSTPEETWMGYLFPEQP